MFFSVFCLILFHLVSSKIKADFLEKLNLITIILDILELKLNDKTLKESDLKIE